MADLRFLDTFVEFGFVFTDFGFQTLVAELRFWTLMADFGFRTLVADLRFWTTVADFFGIFSFFLICVVCT